MSLSGGMPPEGRKQVRWYISIDLLRISSPKILRCIYTLICSIKKAIQIIEIYKELNYRIN